MKKLLLALAAFPALAHAAPQSPDRMELYLRAKKAIIPAKPPVDATDDPEFVRDQKVRAERYSLARKEAWLRQNAAGFALFQQALKAPYTSRGVEDFTAQFPVYGQLRQLARYKLVEVHAREMRGNWNGAVQSRLDIIQMGNDALRGGPLISHLVGVAVEAIGRDTPWYATEQLTLAQTRAALTRLEGIYAKRSRPAAVLEAEKQFGLKQLRAYLRDPHWREIERLDDEASTSDRAKARIISPETIERNYQRRMDAQIANAYLPYGAPKQAIPKAEDPYNAIFGSEFHNIGFSFARNDAGNAVWLVTLALRAHRLERGEYPGVLRALVPGFLRNVPSDPFGRGEALRYKRTGSTYLLWSIGPDELDNGGVPIDWENPRIPIPGETQRLPHIAPQSKGDFVAGKNR